MFSSMSMSLNSLESKTSPHSWHSTNSTSSSRATMRTRGCLQTFFIAVVSEGFFAIVDVWIGFIFGSRHDSPAPLSNSGYFYAGIAACQDIFWARQWVISKKLTHCRVSASSDSLASRGPSPGLQSWVSAANQQTFIAAAMNPGMALTHYLRTGAGFWPPYRRHWMRIPRPGVLLLRHGRNARIPCLLYHYPGD